MGHSLKKLVMAVVAVITFAGAAAQNSSSINWTLSRSWSNGFDALPDVSTNLDEFRSQYLKNQTQWDATFNWLATHDLTTVEKGKYPIEGTSLTVSVEDSENQPLAKRSSESHYNHIDFQYVVKGTERFGILDHDSSTANCEYNPTKDVIHYDYDVEKTMFIDSTPKRFLLFFPCDWHIAKVATDEDSQVIRVIVVKLDYVE